jgi:hypothetical protein
MTELDAHRWAVVVAHPGHELRAFHFLERTKPMVCVLTDGSGWNGPPRIDDTARLLAGVGAKVGPVFGSLNDRSAYAHLMSVESGVFVNFAAALAAAFIRKGITAVVTDAAEEYNPVHDVCRALSECAVSQCGRATPRLWELDLVRDPRGCGDGLRLHLDDEAFGRKLEAVRRYAPLAAEAAAAFDQHGVEAFRTEFFRPAEAMPLPPSTYVPHYERIGDERVRAGRYDTTLRYGQHVRPVLAALLNGR